jgi:hypothetical protein
LLPPSQISANGSFQKRSSEVPQRLPAVHKTAHGLYHPPADTICGRHVRLFRVSRKVIIPAEHLIQCCQLTFRMLKEILKIKITLEKICGALSPQIPENRFPAAFALADQVALPC